MPDKKTNPNNTCVDCNGTGKILLLNSFTECECVINPDQAFIDQAITNFAEKTINKPGSKRKVVIPQQIK